MYDIRCADPECKKVNHIKTLNDSFTCTKCGIYNLVIGADCKKEAGNIYDKTGKLMEE